MSIAALIRSMADAGAPTEAIALAVEAIEAEARKDAERRAKQAERKRRSRALERDGLETVHGLSSDRTVTVTGQSQDPSPPLKERSPTPPKENNPPTPENPRLPSEVAPKGAGQRGSALPTDWEPKPRHFAKAESLGLPAGWIRSQADAMREWAGANRNRAVARKADWDLTFDGFIRRDAPLAQRAKREGKLVDLPSHPADRTNTPMIDLGREIVAEALVVSVIERGAWIDRWGEGPGKPGCKIPERLLHHLKAA